MLYLLVIVIIQIAGKVHPADRAIGEPMCCLHSFRIFNLFVNHFFYLCLFELMINLWERVKPAYKEN